MCEICKNNSIRNYIHSKNKHHLRLLLKIMKIKKNNGFLPYCIRGEGHSMPILNVNRDAQLR